MPTPLIHIGFYKAASTWLQKRYFCEQFGYQRVMDSLRLQVHYLDPKEPEYQASASRARLAAQMEPIIQRGLCPVISSEGLCGDLLRGGHNQQHNARRLREITEGEPRILLVVREQRQLLRSAYKTLVYFGESRNISRLLQPLSASESPRFHPGFLCFDRLVELYQDLFSAPAVLVLPYEMFRDNPRAFLRRIREHVGLEAVADSHFDSLPFKQKLNASDKLGFIEGQRVVNRLAGNARTDFSGRNNHSDFARVIRRIAWHKQHNRSLPVDNWLEQRFHARVEALTQGVFADSNRRLQQLTGLDLAPYGYQ